MKLLPGMAIAAQSLYHVVSESVVALLMDTYGTS